MSLHFKRDGARYVFRGRVPKFLIDHLGRGELIRSIGSVAYDTAKREARRLAVASDVLFTMLTDNPALTQAKIDELASHWFREAVAAGEQRLTRLRPDDPDDRSAERDLSRRQVEGTRELLRINNWPAMADSASEILADHGIVLEADDPRFMELCRKLLRANAAAASLYANRRDGNYGYMLVDPLFAVKEQAIPSPGAVRQRKPMPPAAVSTPTKLFGLIDKHMAIMARKPVYTTHSDAIGRHGGAFRPGHRLRLLALIKSIDL